MASMSYSTNTYTPLKEEKRELLIFAVYLLIGTQSETKSRTRLEEYHAMLKTKFTRIENLTNYLIEIFVFPIREGETKMECIFQGDGVKDASELTDLAKYLAENEGGPNKGFTVGDEPKEEDDFLYKLSDKMNEISRNPYVTGGYKAGNTGLYE